MKNFKIIILLIFISLFVSQLVFAQKTWEKDWQTWSKNDTFKIINDSPWAKSIRNVDVNYYFAGINNNAFREGSLLAAAPPVILRLYSSLKIRQALLRQVQLQENYNEMSSAQKKAFDEKHNVMLECANCKNYYVFILLHPVDDSGVKGVVGEAFKDDQLSDLKGKIFLVNDKKETRELEQFAAPKSYTDAAVFYFPIMDENQTPLINSTTKKITFRVRTGMLRGKAFLEDIEFDVSKMIVDGKLNLN